MALAMEELELQSITADDAKNNPTVAKAVLGCSADYEKEGSQKLAYRLIKILNSLTPASRATWSRYVNSFFTDEMAAAANTITLLDLLEAISINPTDTEFDRFCKKYVRIRSCFVVAYKATRNNVQALQSHSVRRTL